ncbi:MAG: GNAT family N-acetyltransferase [Alphaproteobacteria bacterium]|nr:GNAT family N-acetyltransferase [Alphaproteobacteria bacterium]
MFARTKRLTLRPGWPEDAPAVARAIGHEGVVRMLAKAPWPYALANAESFLSQPRAPSDPSFLIFSHEGARPRLVGGIGLAPDEDGHELGYWLTPDAWGRGYATEAGRQVVAIARHALGLRRLHSGHFIDNPASGRVLHKLGFRPTGRVVGRYSAGRAAIAPCRLFELDLAEEADAGDTCAMAA